jgi:hypothetical protein
MTLNSQQTPSGLLHRAVRGAAIILTVIHLTACGSEPKPMLDVSQRLDGLYATYLTGSLDQAKKSLHDAVVLLEDAKFAKPGAQSHGLWLAYSRLHVLESRSGNANLAEASLLKARYWYLRKLELSGESTEQAVEAVRVFTSEKCLDIVEQFDRKHGDGKGPNYTRQR